MKCAADFRAEARAVLKGRWKLAVGVGFLAAMLGGATGVDAIDLNFGLVDGNFQVTLSVLGQRLNPIEMMHNIGVGSAFAVWQYFSVIAVLAAIVRLVVGSVFEVGYAKFNMDLIDGEEGSLETLFRYFRQWGTMLAAALLQAVYIIGWMLLLIIPGFIAMYRYRLTGYILAENPEMDANDAITRSKELMKGNKWRLFCLDLSFIGWEILCMLTLGIGNLWLTPYRSAAWAAFYRELVPLEKEARTEEMQEEENTVLE